MTYFYSCFASFSMLFIYALGDLLSLILYVQASLLDKFPH